MAVLYNDVVMDQYNKQPGIQKFEMHADTIKISTNEYDPLINRIWFYSNTKIYGGNEFDKCGHLYIFTSLIHFFWSLVFIMDLFLHHVKDTDSMQGHAALMFKVETLLDDAFNMISLSPSIPLAI